MTTLSLTALAPGQLAQINPEGLSVGTSGNGAGQLAADNADLLRAMGLRPHASVRLCRLGDPCIVQVGHARGDSCRLGVARHIADQIRVCIAPEMPAQTASRA